MQVRPPIQLLLAEDEILRAPQTLLVAAIATNDVVISNSIFQTSQPFSWLLAAELLPLSLQKTSLLPPLSNHIGSDSWLIAVAVFL